MKRALAALALIGVAITATACEKSEDKGPAPKTAYGDGSLGLWDQRRAVEADCIAAGDVWSARYAAEATAMVDHWRAEGIEPYVRGQERTALRGAYKPEKDSWFGKDGALWTYIMDENGDGWNARWDAEDRCGEHWIEPDTWAASNEWPPRPPSEPSDEPSSGGGGGSFDPPGNYHFCVGKWIPGSICFG